MPGLSLGVLPGLLAHVCACLCACARPCYVHTTYTYVIVSCSRTLAACTLPAPVSRAWRLDPIHVWGLAMGGRWLVVSHRPAHGLAAVAAHWRLHAWRGRPPRSRAACRGQHSASGFAVHGKPLVQNGGLPPHSLHRVVRGVVGVIGGALADTSIFIIKQ